MFSLMSNVPNSMSNLVSNIRAECRFVLDPGPDHGNDNAMVVPVQENHLATLEHEDGRVEQLV